MAAISQQDVEDYASYLKSVPSVNPRDVNDYLSYLNNYHGFKVAPEALKAEPTVGDLANKAMAATNEQLSSPHPALTAAPQPPPMAPDNRGFLQKASDLEDQAVGFLGKGHNPFFKMADVMVNTPQGRDLRARAANMVGGNLRTGAAELYAKSAGEPWNSEQEAKLALEGRAPKTSEYLQRFGAPELGNTKNIPLVGKYVPEITGRGALGFVGDALSDAPVIAEMNGGAGNAVEEKGRDVYGSAFKNVQKKVDESPTTGDLAPILEKRGFTGSMEDAMSEAKNATRDIHETNKGILKDATRAGAEVDMNRAVQEAQDYVDELRKIDNPEGRGLIKKLQTTINKYRSRGAQEPGEELLNMPTSKVVTEAQPQGPALAYDAANEMNARVKGIPYDQATTELTHGEIPNKLKHKMESVPVITEANTPVAQVPGEPVFKNQDSVWDTSLNGWEKNAPKDTIRALPQATKYVEKMAPSQETGLITTERLPGPNPIQANAWKSQLYNRLGDKAYNELSATAEGRDFLKALASGHKQAIEEAVTKALGEERGAALKSGNQDITTLLKARRPLRTQANAEITKNPVTQVDWMFPALIGQQALQHGQNPFVAAAEAVAAYGGKKAISYANTTSGRTAIGQGLISAGKSGLIDPALNAAILERGLLNKKDTKKENKKEAPAMRLAN